MKGANTLRVGSLFWEEKKRVDFSHNKIGRKFDIFYGRSQFV